MKKHILFIAAKDHTIARCQQLGIDCSLVQLGYLHSPYQSQVCLNYHELSLTQPQMVLQQNISHVVEVAEQIHSARPIDAVVTFLEFTQEATAAIAKRLNIATNIDEQAMELTRCKFNMRTCLSDTGLHAIPFAKVDSLAALSEFFAKQSHPVIVKPAQGAASKGVCLVKEESELAEAFVQASDNGNAEVIVEGYIDTDLEYSVESLSIDGRHELIAFTEKTVQGAPHFVEVGHVQPAQIETQLQQSITEQVITLLQEIGHKNGPAHTELKVKDSVPYIIETQLRIGGDQIWELTELTTGRSQISETLAHLVSLPAPKPTLATNAAAIRFVMPENVRTESRPDVLIEHDGINRVELEESADWTRKSRANHSGERLGYCLATGHLVEHAKNAIDKCFDTFMFH